jgi:hypothetical protein
VIGIRLQVHSVLRAGMKRAHEMAGSTHAVVRCKSNQILHTFNVAGGRTAQLSGAVSSRPPVSGFSLPARSHGQGPPVGHRLGRPRAVRGLSPRDTSATARATSEQFTLFEKAVWAFAARTWPGSQGPLLSAKPSAIIGGQGQHVGISMQLACTASHLAQLGPQVDSTGCIQLTASATSFQVHVQGQGVAARAWQPCTSSRLLTSRSPSR